MKVLMVDDDEGDARMAKEALSAMGLEFHWALSGDECIEFLEREGMPGAIFMDINMPGKNGFDTIEAMKEKWGTEVPPVIMLTTANTEVDIVASIEAGAVSYLQKPATPANVRSAFFGSRDKALAEFAQQIKG